MTITRFLKKFVQRPVAVLTIFAMVVGPFSAISFPSFAEAATTLFSDGFETTPNAFLPWTSGNPDSGQWNANNSAHSGGKSAEVKGSTTADLQESISTTGYTDLTLSFWYQFSGLDDGDSLVAEWYDGSSWYTLATFSGADGTGDDLTTWTQWSGALPVGAENNSDFAIRFAPVLNNATDNFYLDDVSLTADTVIPTIPECSSTDTVAFTTFDTFSDGSVNGQNSWSATGASYDQEIVPNTYGYEEFGCKSLRLSDAVTSGSFGDWIFAAPVADEAGETGIGTVNHFEAQFDLASVMPDSEQTGLKVSVSPDDGNGSRMSYLAFTDESDGVHVTFFDVTNAGPLPSVTSWNATDITTLDRSEPHTIKFEMDFVDGPGNDVVKIYIDGLLAHTGTSWEDYYRYDAEQNGNGNQLFGVDTLIFQARGTAHPANDGNGFLFDNLSLSSSNVEPETGAIEITKYLCPLGTEVNRDANDVGGTVPDGCELQEGAYFGYVHGNQDETGAPYPEWSASVTSAGSTDSNGVLTISDLAPDGRYVVFETDESNNKLANDELLGLYCEGDGDPDPYHNDNGDITFVPEGGTTHCVAYNESDEPLQTEVRVSIFKYVDGEIAIAGSFPMQSSWSADNVGSGSGNYSLGASGAGTTTPFAAQTSAMSVPADYATSEVAGGSVVGIGEECPIDGYRLVGYRWGETLGEAEAMTATTTAPSFTDLTTDMYVIVDNESCQCDADASYTIYSDSETQVDGHDAFAITPHPAWTASIPGASWIWSEDINAPTESAAVGTEVFTRSFTIDGTPLGATLKIATDNTYSVSVNGVWVADSSASLNHFAVAETVIIPVSVLLPGNNEIEISVNNASGTSGNPAGLLYALTVGTNECEVPQVKVHILKYLYDGETTVVADTGSTDGFAFPMNSSWSANNTGTGSGSYTLSPSGYSTSTAYAADTTGMDYPADYSTYEDTTGDVLPIGAMCIPGKWRLEGYRVGNTLGEAEAATLSTTAPGFTDLQQDKYVIVVNRDCDTVPTATVTMCKYDTEDNALSGWTLMLKGAHIEDVNVLANSWIGASTVNTLYAGVSYIATAMGAWFNSGGNGGSGNYADTEYVSNDSSWTAPMDGPAPAYPYRLDLQQDNAFLDWGPFNSSHTYAHSFMGMDTTTSFRVFDGTGSTPNTGWYNDNDGSLDVSIDYGYAGITGEDGCVTFADVPYGEYAVEEIAQYGWGNISGLGDVSVDEPEELFNVVNQDLLTETGNPTLTIVKHTKDEDGTFTFSLTGETSTTTDITTVEGGGFSATIDLEEGTTTVTEIVPEGWVLASSYCEYDESSIGIAAPNGEEIYVEGDDHVICYFDNELEEGPTETEETIVVHHGDLATSFGDIFSDPSKWFFYNDLIDAVDNSLGGFVNGPGAAPLGIGSAQVSVTGLERRNLSTYQFFGTPLSQIDAMEFSTYNPSAGNGGSADRSGYLVFNVSFDGTDTWQKRLIYVPSVDSSISQDVWQVHDAIQGGNALWSWSGLLGHGGSGTMWPDSDTDEYRTWDDLISSFPNIQIRDTDSHLGIRVGEPYADGYTENIDRFLITINNGSNATTTIFDFEPRQSTVTTITNATDLEDNSSLVGQPFSVEWLVTAGSGTPTGTVEVTANGGAGCSAPVEDGACNITPSDAGGIVLIANYSGDTGFDASSSDDVTHQVVEDSIDTEILSIPGGPGGNSNPFSFFGFAASTGGGAVLGASDEGDFGEQCELYLTAFIKPGGANDPEQVRRLQYVLQVLENMDVEQNGIYDAKTIAAVHAFQSKYASEILAPWGISHSTGFVYLTTRKKLNEIYCAGQSSFPLTLEELAIIEQSKMRGNSIGISNNTTPTPKKDEETPADTDEDSQDEDTSSENGQSASAGSSSGGEGLWGFIRGLFGF